MISTCFSQCLISRTPETSDDQDGDRAYWKLEESVDIMARLQLGRKLSEEEIGKITAFLKTLTGEQPSFALPILPPSNNDTPRPQPFE